MGVWQHSMGINHLVRWCLVLASAARAAASSLVWDDFDFYDPTLASTTSASKSEAYLASARESTL